MYEDSDENDTHEDFLVTESDLADHYNPKPKFPCDKCQKVFGNEDKMNFHVKSGNEETSNYWVKDVESSEHGKTFYKGILHFNNMFKPQF